MRFVQVQWQHNASGKNYIPITTTKEFSDAEERYPYAELRINIINAPQANFSNPASFTRSQTSPRTCTSQTRPQTCPRKRHANKCVSTPAVNQQVFRAELTRFYKHKIYYSIYCLVFAPICMVKELLMVSMRFSLSIKRTYNFNKSA